MKKQEITHIEARPSRLVESMKWAGVLVLIVLAITGFYYFSAYPLYIRVVALLIIAALTLFLAAQTVQGRLTWAFIQGARSEARKVVWPTRQETTQLTIIVLVVVVIASICLWVIDFVLFRLIALLTG